MFRLAFLSLFFVFSSYGAITVENLKDGEELRYSVPIIRGTLSNEATTVKLVNTSSGRATREMVGLAHNGQFKIL